MALAAKFGFAFTDENEERSNFTEMICLRRLLRFSGINFTFTDFSRKLHKVLANKGFHL